MKQGKIRGRSEICVASRATMRTTKSSQLQTIIG